MKLIAASEPINRTAAIVISKGVGFETNISKDTINLEVKPAIKAVTKSDLNDSLFKSIITARFGRFSVIGVSAEYAKRWVIRCDCGRYEFITAKAILNPLNKRDRCKHCMELYSIQRKSEKKDKFMQLLVAGKVTFRDNQTKE